MKDEEGSEVASGLKRCANDEYIDKETDVTSSSLSENECYIGVDTIYSPGCTSDNITFPSPVTDNNKKVVPPPTAIVDSRSIYVGGVTGSVTAHDILRHVRTGGAEALRFMTDKACAFLDFISPKAAALFWESLNGRRKLKTEKGVEIRFSWATSTILPAQIENAIKNGATRIVYFGNLSCFDGNNKSNNNLDELKSLLERECSVFGLIDIIRIVPEKKCAFVYFASISDAIKAVAAFNRRDATVVVAKRIDFGKDPLIAPTEKRKKAKSDHTNNNNETEEGEVTKDTATLPSTKVHQQEAPQRTVYLGSLSNDATLKDVCDSVRGGILEKVRFAEDRNCAFVTFLDPLAASQFHYYTTNFGIYIRGFRAKVGWGQSSQIPNALIPALKLGATRTLIISNLEAHKLGEAFLKESFSRYGPIESVNLMRRERNMAIINFCQIIDAAKAMESVKSDPLFTHCTLSFGKDRCSLPLPPLPPQYTTDSHI